MNNQPPDIQLSIRFLQPAPFPYFWLKEVTGFDPTQHCTRCLVGRFRTDVVPFGVGRRHSYVTTQSISIRPGSYLYLCGVRPSGSRAGMPGYRDNLHVPMRPVPGATLHVVTPHVDVRAFNAEAMPIPAVDQPDLLPLGQEHTQCRNFMWGASVFHKPGGMS